MPPEHKGVDWSLYTVQLARARKLPSRIEVIDITVKSAVSPWDVFAPTWGMVQNYKESGQNERQQREFTKEYARLMRTRYQYARKTFEVLAQKAVDGDIALACYCSPNGFCHRYILKDILLKMRKEIEYRGELPGALIVQQALF